MAYNPDRPKVVIFLELEIHRAIVLYHYTPIAVYACNKKILCANCTYIFANEKYILVSMMLTKCSAPRLDALWYRVQDSELIFTTGIIYTLLFYIYTYIYIYAFIYIYIYIKPIL